jgi:hypothetical protein
MTNVRWDYKKRQLDAALRMLTGIGGGQAEGAAPASTPDAPATEAAGPEVTMALVVAPTPDPSRTLMRLVVGTALLSWDELARRAAEWERQAALGACLPDVAVAGDVPEAPDPAGAEARERTRRALIGWIFATQEQLRATHHPTRWLQSAASHMFGTAIALANEALGAIGDIQRARTAHVYDPTVARWIVLGRAEEQRSRALARAALRDIMEDVIDYLAGEPAIQELIRAQSTSLASDALGEVRERTVSADLFVDTIVRRLLRRVPAQSQDSPVTVQRKE